VKFIKFIYNEKFGYVQNASSGYSYDILSDFLTDENIAYPDSFRNWLYDPTAFYFSGNITMIDKNDDGTLRLYFDPVMELSDDQIEKLKEAFGEEQIEQELILSRKNFTHIVDEWTKCRLFKCNEIWIKHDNGIFWVEGVK
jgi:hypothetical protein